MTPGNQVLRVYLVGFMGSGKTRLGALVAEQLNLDLVDIDDVVEETSGMTVREIFERHGEAYFRDLEHHCLAQTQKSPRVVVATGGGTFAVERNRDLIRQLGRSIFIDVEFDTIVERMGEAGRQSRPLFDDAASARALFAQRRPSYSEADVIVKVQPGEAAEAVAAKILAAAAPQP